MAALRRRRVRRRGGYSVVLTTSMMLTAVAIMGSSLLIWANMSFDIRRENASEVFLEGSNVLKEHLVLEDAWFDAGPPKYVNVTVMNVGGIVANIAKVSLNGTLIWSQGEAVFVGEAGTIYVEYDWSEGVYSVAIETERGSLLSEVVQVSG